MGTNPVHGGEPSRQPPPEVEERPIAEIFGPLAEQPIWLQWRTRYGEDGKPRKVPYAASGGEFSVADPETWGTLADVERMLERGARRGTKRAPDGSVPPGGVGIVLGSHLGGIDLDACIDAEGNVASWAREIAERLKSYTEISPSGTGLKIFFTYPQLPEHHWRSSAKRPAIDGGKDPGIEFYLRGRYFAVTGRQFENYDTIRRVQVGTLLGVQRFMNDFAPDASAKANGAHGPQEGVRPDPDLALAALAVIPNDEAFTGRDAWLSVGMALHDVSATDGSEAGLQAWTKWTATAGHTDAKETCTAAWKSFKPGGGYAIGTLLMHAQRRGFDQRAWQEERRRRAFSGLGARMHGTNGHANGHGAGASEGESTDAEDDPLANASAQRWIGKKAPPLRFVIDELIPAKMCALVAGEGAAGKSILMHTAATCVANGKSFMGHAVEQGPALYITAEDDEDVLHNRQERINGTLGLSMEEASKQLHVMSTTDADYDFVLFSNGAPMPIEGRLERSIAKHGITFAAIDSAALVFDDDEIRRRPVTVFLRRLNALAKRTGCAIALVTHTSKSSDATAAKMASGSTAWVNGVRAGLLLAKAKNNHVELSLLKPNHAKKGIVINLYWTGDGVLTTLPPLSDGPLARAHADEQVMKAVKECWEGDGEPLSKAPQAGYRYLPAYMAGRDLLGEAAAEKAMKRLLTQGRIVNTSRTNKRAGGLKPA